MIPRAHALRTCVLLASLLAVGCGSDGSNETSSVSPTGAGQAGQASSGAAGSPAAAGNASAGQPGQGGSAPGGAGGTTTAGQGGAPQAGSGGTPSAGGPSSGGNGGTTPPLCGGEAGLVCPDGFYCDFTNNYCGGEDSLGTCLLKPDSCPQPEPLPPPVCGCDGKVYTTECAAAQAGVDVSLQNSCTKPANQFKCGEKFCQLDHYCQVAVSDVGSEPTTYACIPLPTQCLVLDALPSCSCVQDEPCAKLSCQDDGKGAVTVVCPGG